MRFVRRRRFHLLQGDCLSLLLSSFRPTFLHDAFPKEDITTVAASSIPSSSDQEFSSTTPQNSSLKIPFLRTRNVPPPSTCKLPDHIHPPAICDFMDDVYSRHCQDLPNSSHPHTLLLVQGKLLQLFSCLNFPFPRFLSRSYFFPHSQR